jgi:N-acetylmuramoyl-L-alanine amidase
MKIAISAGHSAKCRGASDILDEFDENVRMVDQVAADLAAAGHSVVKFIDTKSTTQNANLNAIVDWHNAQTRELDVSVHFNCYEHTSKPMGTECLWVTQQELADEVATAIARASGLIDRGPKQRTDLFFLNNTEEPAILIETCFVDSSADVQIYQDHFEDICRAIVEAITGEEAVAPPEPPEEALVHVAGSCSWFGGPNDTGVSPSEGLAFLYEVSDAPDLFLPTQPPGTSGLARRLDPETFYVACRFDYSVTSKELLRDQSKKALVRANDREFLARPADWGPNENTGRVADLSPGLMEALGIDTDDDVEVIYPAPTQPQPEPEPERATVAIQITASGPVTVTINGTPVGEF